MWLKVRMNGVDMGPVPVYAKGFADGAYAVYDLLPYRKYLAWERKVIKLVNANIDAKYGDVLSFNYDGLCWDFTVADLDNCGCEWSAMS